MKKHKVYPTLITDRKQAKESVKDFGLNLCKTAEYFRSDKNLVVEAVSNNPYAVRFADKEVAKEPEVQKALGSAKSKVEKFYLDAMEKVIDTSKPYNVEDYQNLIARNRHAFDKQQNVAVILSSGDNKYVKPDEIGKYKGFDRSR